jgi:hypothetical protein
VEVRHSHEQSLVSKRSYLYDETDVRTRQIVEWYSGDGALEFTWIHIYDDRGNVIEQVYRHHGKDFRTRWSYTYAGEDERASETFYNSLGAVFSGTRTVKEYDSQGRLIETIRYDCRDRQQSRAKYRYNERGDLTESISFNPDDSLYSKTTYEYEYDERGNWIEKRTYITNNLEEEYRTPSLFQYRTITYHD